MKISFLERLLKMPYGLLLALAAALLVKGCCTPGSIDIHLHDTYFIILWLHVYMMTAITVLVWWVIYRIAERILLSKALSQLHILSFWLLYITTLSGFDPTTPIRHPARYYDLTNKPFYAGTPKAIVAICGIFLAAQLLFIINVVAGIIKRLLKEERK